MVVTCFYQASTYCLLSSLLQKEDHLIWPHSQLEGQENLLVSYRLLCLCLCLLELRSWLSLLHYPGTICILVVVSSLILCQPCHYLYHWILELVASLRRHLTHQVTAREGNKNKFHYWLWQWLLTLWVVCLTPSLSSMTQQKHKNKRPHGGKSQKPFLPLRFTQPFFSCVYFFHFEKLPELLERKTTHSVAVARLALAISQLIVTSIGSIKNNHVELLTIIIIWK